MIIDARFSSVALANRMKGGGYEYSEYYTNCEIQFMNLENIHVIRSSFQSLRVLCQLSNDNRTYVENSSLILLPFRRLLYSIKQQMLNWLLGFIDYFKINNRANLIRFNAYYRCLFLRLLKTFYYIQLRYSTVCWNFK